MKKMTVIMAFGLLLFAPCAFAASGDVQKGTMEMGDVSDPEKGVRVGLSPEVSAAYINEGENEAGSQWFAIGTMHAGGDIAYATAQNLSNVWKQTFVTGTEASTIFAKIPTNKESEEVWSTQSWEK